MSFAEKIGSLMQRPNEDLVDKDEVPTWMKYAGRGLGTVGGGFAIFLGLWTCLGILLADVQCLLGGMWQILAGFATIVIEAPCCCVFLDHVQTISDKVDKRPYWNRAAFYMVIGIPAIFMCPGLSTLMGSGLIFGTGIVYGMMALGKKGTRADMAAVASPTSVVPPSSDHHSTLMEDPDVWRPT
ncbi:calcium channel flower isoform X3 [Bemisia tabaci]|uniref:calcium channel flower isoform X3 n=1 Tax=Bemisia tabaci TaxID=7038 RepID=UPI001947A1B8